MAGARTQDAANPVLVVVTRGPLVESRHRGAAVVADAEGAVVASWGDIDRPVLPRSAVKPLQAMAMVESGGAEKFDLGDVELALACASHRGQPRHVFVERIIVSSLESQAAALDDPRSGYPLGQCTHCRHDRITRSLE